MVGNDGSVGTILKVVVSFKMLIITREMTNKRIWGVNPHALMVVHLLYTHPVY